VQLSDVGSIIVTHGHGDHFLMLMHEELRDRKVYVHPSDGRMIQDYAIGYPDWMKYITAFAEEAGSSFAMDEFSIWSPASLPSTSWEGYELIDVIDGDEILNGYRVYHTPGHAPGHICVKVGPVLFVGDHILSITTPHQTPESYRQGLGLATYLASLRKVADMEVMLGLAGHENPIYPVGDRALEIEAFHHQRLKELVDLCQKDMNLYQLTDKYYRNHPELLGAPTLANLDEVSAVTAMEEIKAHVEYLINDDRMSVTDNANGILLYRSS